MAEDQKTEETKTGPVDSEKIIALKEKIKAAFALFDKEAKGCVVQEEVSTIMRYLGVFPSERKVVESILPDMQGDEPALYVTYEKFEKKMVEVMENHEDEPDMDDTLLKAFRTIDTEGLGYVEADQMKELLETHGTPFRAKEVDSFLSRAKDMETGRIYYEDYIAMMVSELEQMDL
jgi:Ca2+-binding EF-hand superfamily protein